MGIHQNESEIKICGKNVVKILFERSPELIIRLYIAKDQISHWAPLLKFCADKKKAYHVVSSQELESISASLHHEGICALIRSPEKKSIEATLLSSQSTSPQLYLALVGIKNPHNIGAIARSANHFKVDGIIIHHQMSLTASAYRVSEGGLLMTPVIVVKDWYEDLKKIKKNSFCLLSTSPRGQSLFKFSWPKKTLLLLGEEKMGLDKQLLELSDQILSIPNYGEVESLNVSCAVTSFLTHYRINSL